MNAPLCKVDRGTFAEETENDGVARSFIDAICGSVFDGPDRWPSPSPEVAKLHLAGLMAPVRASPRLGLWPGSEDLKDAVPLLDLSLATALRGRVGGSTEVAISRGALADFTVRDFLDDRGPALEELSLAGGDGADVVAIVGRLMREDPVAARSYVAEGRSGADPTEWGSDARG